MYSTDSTRTKCLAAVCAVLLTLALTAAAQPGFRDQQLRGLPEHLLDDEQRAAVREMMRTHREGFRELDEKLREARRELGESVRQPDTTDQELQEQLGQLARLEAEQRFRRIKIARRVRSMLSPEQAERLRDLQESRRGERFEGRGEGFRERRVRPGPGPLPPRGRPYFRNDPPARSDRFAPRNQSRHREMPRRLQKFERPPRGRDGFGPERTRPFYYDERRPEGFEGREHRPSREPERRPPRESEERNAPGPRERPEADQ